jgi:hypothetical protein
MRKYAIALFFTVFLSTVPSFPDSYRLTLAEAAFAWRLMALPEITGGKNFSLDGGNGALELNILEIGWPLGSTFGFPFSLCASAADISIGSESDFRILPVGLKVFPLSEWLEVGLSAGYSMRIDDVSSRDSLSLRETIACTPPMNRDDPSIRFAMVFEENLDFRNRLTGASMNAFDFRWTLIAGVRIGWNFPKTEADPFSGM